MNNSSFLILGRESSLSFAEIYQFLGHDKIEQCSHDAIFVKDGELGKKAAEILGGVPKSGIIVRKTDELSPELLAESLRPYIVADRKFHFGISLYSEPPPRIKYGAGSTPFPRQTRDRLLERRGLKTIGLAVKKILKQAGFSVRLVESKSGNLSSVEVVKNKLLAGGVELCIFVTNDGYLVGKTESVQPFADYSRRDYGRPSRDARSGMLPPKVAKAMINIAAGHSRANDKETGRGLSLLDPFCGSGTILQEGLLAGYNVVGADVSDKAVASSRRNLDWLATQSGGLPSWRVERADTRHLEKVLKPRSVDIIVSEFHLGPPLSGRESESQIAAIEKQLCVLYSQALPPMSRVLKDNGRAVFAWPYFKKHDVFVSVFDELSRLGWEIVEPYPPEYQKTFPLSRRRTLLYGRSDQRLWREILVLRPS